MIHYFFAWQGGEGGDFLMSMINYMLNGVEPTINSNGTAIESNDFTWKFARNGSRCIKVHVPWEEDAFTNAKNRKIIWLTNPDTTIWAKKRLLKLRLNLGKSKNWMFTNSKFNRKEQAKWSDAFTGNSFIDKKIVTAYKDNDLEKVYYWYYPWLQKMKSKYYDDKMEKLIENLPHVVVRSNMHTRDEIKKALETTLSYLGRPWSKQDKQQHSARRYTELMLQRKKLCKCLNKLNPKYADIINSWEIGLDGKTGFESKVIFEKSANTLTELRKTILEVGEQTAEHIHAIKRLTSMRKILQDEDEQDSFVFPDEQNINIIVEQYSKITNQLLDSGANWKYNLDNNLYKDLT